MTKLETLSALVQLAELKHLPGPSHVVMQNGERDILSLTTDGHEDAIAWCEEFGTGWDINRTNEVWSQRNVTWNGWIVAVHSYTEKS